MPFLNRIKRLSLRFGFYPVARWLSRLLRPAQGRTFWESVRLYRSLLPPNALCFDVGANIGEKSEAMLRAGAGRVVAFEPNPLVLAELRTRCQRWRRWEAVEVALGEAASAATLFAREQHGQSSLSDDWPGVTVAEFPVRVETLDMAIERFGRPDYIKVDVEGGELAVLSGLRSAQPHLLSFEFHLDEEGIPRARECLLRLGRLGAYEVNVTPAESSSFHFSHWRPLGDFIQWFPGDLAKTLPGPSYGDIFVRNR